MIANKSEMSEIRELTDDELNAASGGYQLGGSHDGVGFTQIGSAAGGGGAGKVRISDLSITKVTDSASPAF